MRVLVFDPFAGISGDMVLGALFDLGLSRDWFRDFVTTIGIDDVGIVTGRETRRGIDCGRVWFELPEERVHRHLGQILEIIDRAAVSKLTRERAGNVFQRLAEAEAEIHGIDVEKVHFHEVGALDTILDVLCACAGIEQLGFECFGTRPVALGSGWIDIAHGRFPVPAPATLKLLHGLPVADAALGGECTTPTGAAILAALVEQPRPPQEFLAVGSGYGAGARDPVDRPNCLRLIAGELADGSGETVYVVQADLDDLSPEYVPGAQDSLLQAGALDAVFGPVNMKKGRPGIRLEALVRASALEPVLEALYRNTTTLGARYWAVWRPSLPRTEEHVELDGRLVRRKRVRLPGGGERWKAEYEDVARVARETGRAALDVRRSVEELR
ncbi:MAG: nickel pincer cofactor biosynthesis protein LarC [Longimicrobiales bacterium]